MPPTTAGRQFVEAEVLYAEDVVLQPVISCSSIGKRRSSSLHAIWFVGKLELWDDFEDEVKRNFANIRWENFTAPIAYEVCGKEKSQLPMHRKNHYLCGEESSISGRWVQHVLHPMSVISKVLDYKMVFGDWKATNKRTINFGKAKRAVPLGEKKETDGIRKRQYLIPDYALMVEESGAPRAVGEAKTPWNHDFEQLWVDFGQIGRYMIELELKFGFLTNYDYTYFLKREIIDDTEVIYCSPPVSHKASPFHTGGVSIRQCMLLLQSSVLGDESRWKVPKASNIGIVKQEYREKRGAAKLRATETILSLAQGIPVPEWDDETVDAVKSPSLDGRSKRVRSLSFDHRSSKRVKFDIPSRRPGLRSDSQKAERK